MTEIISQRTVDEFLWRLQLQMDSPWVIVGGAKPLVGTIKGDTVRLRMRIGYRNSFQTVLTGKLSDRGGKARLDCRFSMHPFVLVFMALWLTLIGGATVFSLAQLIDPAARGSARQAGLIPILMLAFGVALVCFGRYLARNERAYLTDFLRNL